MANVKISNLPSGTVAAADTFAIVQGGTTKEGTVSDIKLVPFAVYTVATVPTASSYTGAIIMVSDETGGYVPAFSDGTNWRRVTDRAIVS